MCRPRPASHAHFRQVTDTFLNSVVVLIIVMMLIFNAPIIKQCRGQSHRKQFDTGLECTVACSDKFRNELANRQTSCTDMMFRQLVRRRESEAKLSFYAMKAGQVTQARKVMHILPQKQSWRTVSFSLCLNMLRYGPTRICSFIIYTQAVIKIRGTPIVPRRT